MTMTEKGNLIVYSGPSGVGKGTILKPLLYPEGELVLSVSATTRAPRVGEIDGREVGEDIVANIFSRFCVGK